MGVGLSSAAQLVEVLTRTTGLVSRTAVVLAPDLDMMLETGPLIGVVLVARLVVATALVVSHLDLWRFPIPEAAQNVVQELRLFHS